MPGLGRNIGDAYIDVHADTGPFRRELRSEARAAGAEAGQEFDRSLGSRLGNLNIGIGRLRGSRNDFLNIVGSMAAGLENIFGSSIREGFARVGSVVAGFGRTIAQADGPLKVFGERLDSIGLAIGRLGGGGLDGLLIQLAAVLISFQVMVAVAGPLASGISGLAAAFTALAVGIGGAIAGGILALGPGLVALASGVGALTIAFTGLSKQQQAVFRPLQNLFEEVRGSIQGALFQNAGNQVQSLVQALRPLGSVLTSLAGVFSEWATDVLAAVGPGGPLGRSFQTLGTALPGLLRNTLNILSGLSGALTGLFAGATPGAERLFASIARVVGQFNEWANSVRGQTAINDFVQQAIDLLGTLWDLAKQIGGTLSNLWELGGAEAAQQILQMLVNSFADLNAHLATPGGREAVLAFFRNGVQVMSALGPILMGLINLFNTLDTSFNRIQFQVFLGHVRAAIGAITSFVSWTQNIIEALNDFQLSIGNTINEIGSLGTRASQAGQQFRTTLSNAFLAVRNAIAPLVQRILSLRSPMQLAAESGQRLRAQIVSAFNSLAASVANGVSRARNALSSLASGISSAVSRGASALGQLAGRAASALASFVSSIQRGISNALSALGQFAGRAVGTLAGLGSRFYSMGVELMQGLYNGVVARAGSVISYIGGLADRVAGAFASALGIASPSKLFRVFGGNIIDGLVEGMQRQEREAEREGDAVAKSVVNGAQRGLQAARASLKNTATIVLRSLAEAGENPYLVKAFKTLGNRMIRSLTNGLDDGREAAQGDIKKIIEQISKTAQKLMEGENAKTRKSIQAQANSLQQWVRGQGAALDAVWREVDRAGVRLDNARARLKELQDQYNQLRESVRDQLRGELNLGSSVGQDGTTTFDQVAANVAGLAAKMRKFAGLLKKLVAAGLPAALVQEVASLGSTEGIAVANALLSGTDAQRRDLIADFTSIQNSTSQIGTILAEQMYRAGVDAQKGLIEGLEANEKALIEAAKRIAKRITDEVKRELGIKSPSTVFRDIGLNITQGLANGLDAGKRTVDASMRALVPTEAISNLNAPLSNLGAQGVGGSGLAGGGMAIAPGAIQIVTPFANPRLVAQEFLDALAARGK